MQRFSWSLLLVTLALIALGCVGIARSEELAAGSGAYAKRQMVWAAVSLVAMLVVSLTNYRLLCRISYGIFALSLGLLIAVYFFPAIHGAHRWIRLGPVSLQPSEFAKVAFVLALARYLMYRENHRRFTGLFIPLAVTMAPVLLILREPDLGTALVFLPVLFCGLYFAGARGIDLSRLILCGLLTVPLLWTQMSREQKSRVTALFEQNAPGEKPTSDGYHLHQAKQMLALGGVKGSYLMGDAVDDRAVYHLPEDHTDFIFTVLCERFGFLGGGGVLLLFVVLVWKGLAVAESTREPYGRLVASGVASLFAVETIINTGMTVGLLPITGLSLPMVSYGGSGLLAHAVAVGLLLNIGLNPGYEVGKEPFRFVG
jgi:cell division protein FtsW (lipid II flippase)